MSNKLIITAAIVGSLPTKEKTPYVPITADEMAADAKACYEAGASVIHVHGRDENQKSTHEYEVFKEIHDKIKAICPELIVQISTGGRAGLGYESRAQGLQIEPEMASLTTGSINFPGMDNSVYENSPALIDKLATDMRDKEICPELEIFDASMIAPAVGLKTRGLLNFPMYFNFVMGLEQIQPASFNQLGLLLNTIPRDCHWNISGVGRTQIWTTYMGIALGGHVRVGLEDNIYYQKGQLATNAQLVERAAKLARDFGRAVATPEEAREILGIKKKTFFK